MPSTVEDTASCALCRRHLLVGEPARLYQDPQSKRFAKVCPLCYERADRRGFLPAALESLFAQTLTGWEAASSAHKYPSAPSSNATACCGLLICCGSHTTPPPLER